MYLKSLTLKGFKSFADKSTLSLEPGLTVVVGPNGSGKSNITDAVLWVLGEQSAKALRGQSMEDVIFAGSSGRKAVGIAEVDLVLDNSDSRLPLEFEEVTITRRMYRSGESEYLLNNTPCRLMDVHELLHDSGIGRDANSIISQGQLDEILNSKPEDRRALIEEAAGVLKHKKRRERAVRKLASMDAYLERARDVIGEVDRQLRPLARQATRAQRYADLTGELRDIETALAVDDLRTLQESWDRLDKQEREQDAELELLKYRLDEKQRDLDKFQSLLEEKGLFVGDLSEQRRRLQSVLERINSGLLLLEEKGKNLVERLSDLRQKLYHSESRIEARAAELERLTSERRDTDARLKTHYSQLAELRRETESSKKERLAADEALSTLTGEARRTRKQVDDARLELSTLEQTLASARIEAEMVADRQADLGEQLEAVGATLAARRGRLEQAQASFTRLRKERALAESDVDKRVRVLESRHKNLAERRDRLATLRAETRALEEIDRAFATASPALAWALSHERDLPGFVGSLAEHISVVAAHERLVENVLGSDLFALLVSDTEAAAQMAAAVRDAAEGELALLPIEGPEPVSATAAGGTPLLDSISCDDSVRPALERLIGDVFVAKDLPSAIRQSLVNPRSRFVTPAGEVVWPSGKITAGRVISDSTGVLERKRRINELADEADAASASVGEAESAVGDAEDALAAAQQDALELSQEIASLAGEEGSLREEIGRLETTATQVTEERTRLETRSREVTERISKQDPERESLNALIADGMHALERLESEAAVARERRDERFREEAAINERLSQCQVDIATVSEREIHLKRQIGVIQAELVDLERTIEQSRVTEEALELLRERIQPIHDLYSALSERADHWADKLRDRARFEQADSESLRTAIHEAQDAVRTAQADIDAHNADVGDLRVGKAQLEVRVKTAAARIVEELGVPLEKALERSPVTEREQAENQAHSLRKQLANMGPVNPIAAQEYEMLNDRREFLCVQIEDLVASRQALSKVIAAIDRKIRERFLETFEEVDRHFQDVFVALFPGGHASLSLTDPDDPEITGIEVVAQPVGKRLTKMSLMSGGEKALTALALLFALYRTRPCPFYILDEVDAALDDANLKRYVAFVEGMRPHTQFVIVTHQRRTMEVADVLYGASMQADGVTKVVSQRLDRSTPQEPADEHAVV